MKEDFSSLRLVVHWDLKPQTTMVHTLGTVSADCDALVTTNDLFSTAIGRSS
jgi:hypothetical protein